MPIELKIPAVGESITEVQISEWLKAEGDSVKQDEPLAVIDSEKTTFDLPAPQNGKLVKILHQAGETVAVGAVVAEFEAGNETAKAEPAEKKASPKPEAKKGAVKKKLKPKLKSRQPSKNRKKKKFNRLQQKIHRKNLVNLKLRPKKKLRSQSRLKPSRLQKRNRKRRRKNQKLHLVAKKKLCR
jgi:pyruvate/2-oxoglutarate dehydrogenase complex dihydrolipoamide acyltransferase (E2) component